MNKHTRFKPPKKVKGYTPCLNDECFFTGTPKEYCAVHHIFYGKHRKLSETWGMKVYLHPTYHNGDKGLHTGNIELDMAIKKFGQMQFEELYDHEFFMEVFETNNL